MNRWVNAVIVLAGKEPGTNWVNRFLQCHRSIKLGRPSQLDPKRGSAFNRATVLHHFELLRATMEKYDICWENAYNMDEKGCQRGGGRGKSRAKYLLSWNQKTHYKFRSDNLELVTMSVFAQTVQASSQALFSQENNSIQSGFKQIPRSGEY